MALGSALTLAPFILVVMVALFMAEFFRTFFNVQTLAFIFTVYVSNFSVHIYGLCLGFRFKG